MMLSFLLALLLGTSVVSLERGDGSLVQGDLGEVTGESWTVAGQRIPIKDVIQVRFPEHDPRSASRFRVSLRGGSELPAKRVDFDGKGVTIERRRQTNLIIPANRIRAIRFRPPLAVTDPTWLGYLGENAASDRIVIRRGENKLDIAEGVVESIADETLGFSIDGQSVKAPMQRLEGVIFGSSQADREAFEIQVDDIYGGVWKVESIRRSGSDWKLSFGGIEHTLPESLIKRIILGGSRTALTSLQPVREQTRSPFGLQLGGDNQLRPSSAVPAGLVMAAGSMIEYRVPDRIESLMGRVRRADKVAAAGKTAARIVVDGKVVWEEIFDDSRSKGFEMTLQNARRIRFEVGDGGDGSLGDLLQFERVYFQK
ncbi:MAG: NPCBM/NEW2 domain-containing protein [Planctomycetota bacterium]